MNLAVKLYSQNPDKPAGMPDNYPWLCKQIGDATDYTDEPGPWLIMTVEECQARKDALKAEYQNWYDATFPPPAQVVP